MENETKKIEKFEWSVNTRSYEKEYWFLDQIIWYLKFDIYEDPLYCEKNFYSSLARYIDLLQKENPNSWETEVQKFINSIKNFSGTEVEKLKYVDKFFRQQQITRYKKINKPWYAKLTENSINGLDFLYSHTNEEWKCRWLMNCTPTYAIPERFYPRFTKSWLEKRVQDRNRDEFVKAMRYWREQADKLKEEL